MNARDLALFLFSRMELSSNFRNLDVYVSVDGKKMTVDKLEATDSYFQDKAGIVIFLKESA